MNALCSACRGCISLCSLHDGEISYCEPAMLFYTFPQEAEGSCVQFASITINLLKVILVL